MMDFGSLAKTQAVSGSRRLKPWGIYPVKFKGIEVREIKGKKDPTMTYRILTTKFEGENGYFNEDTFFPTEASAKRNTYKNKEGHEKEMPSGFEQTMTYIAQLAGVLNPDGFKKMQAASSKFKSFDDVCKALDTILNPKVGTDCFVKLIGRNRDGRVQPAIPNITALNKDGEVFTSDNFISLKEELLGFTEYEETQIKAYKEAKPTPMPVSESVDAPSGHGSEDDEDFSDLL